VNEESKSCRSAESFYTAALLSKSPDPFATIEMQNGVPFSRFFSQPPYGRMACASMPKKLAQRCTRTCISCCKPRRTRRDHKQLYAQSLSNRHRLSNEKKEAEFTQVIKYACCLHRPDPEEEHPRFLMQISAPVAEFSHKYVYDVCDCYHVFPAQQFICSFSVTLFLQ